MDHLSESSEGRRGAYNSYRGMRDRISRSDHYKKNGIGTGWSSFDDFIKDVGPRPKGHHLDRIDPKKGYTKGNVRWAKSVDLSRNRSTVSGSLRAATAIRAARKKGTPIADVAKRYGISEPMVSRIAGPNADRWKGKQGSQNDENNKPIKEDVKPYTSRPLTEEDRTRIFGQ